MKQTILLLTLCMSFLSLKAQQKTLDVVAMHQLIDESRSEHQLQVQAKNQQTVNTANENANLTLAEKLKDSYRRLQQRYSTLGTMINVADIGIDATPMIRQIVANQSQIIKLVQNNQLLIALGYQSEIEFADKASALARYLAGLTLSMDVINQMKPSDRKLLFDYAISELAILQELSGNMVNLLKAHNLVAAIYSLNPFQNYVSADKSEIDHILQNAKFLKR